MESEVRSQESGVRSQEAEVRSQESGVRSQESGVRSQESGVRSQGSGQVGTSLTPDSCPLTPDSCLLTPVKVGCEIYTDVDGIYSTDPRVVPEARKMDVISYDEMLELASVGANVLHSRSVEFAKKFDVPLQKRSSFTDTDGTWIVPEADWMRDIAVCGAAVLKNEARVSVEGVPDQPGVSHRIFSAIAEQNIV